MEKIVMFAKNLESELLAKGIKQKDLALKLGCTPQTISDYIKYGRTNGVKGKKPSLEAVLSIADILELSLDGLFNRNPNDTQKESPAVTVADAIRIISKLEKSVSVSITPDENANFASLCIYLHHDELNSFYTKRDTMRKIFLDETIDEDLYSTWYRAELDKMKEKKLCDSDRPHSAFSDLFEAHRVGNAPIESESEQEAQNGIDET